MTKKETRTRVEGFLVDHIDAGQFWDDDSYLEDIKALAVLGWARAKTAMKINGWKLTDN